VFIETILTSKGSDVYTVVPGATLREAVAILRSEGIGALVVSTDGLRIDGILSERDVVRRLAIDGVDALDMTVARAMTTEVRTCGLDERIESLMSLMTNHRIRHVPVVDSGRLRGLVSIGDLVKARLGELEAENRALLDYVSGSR
jgi:CBS domain-containing protein